MSAFSRSLTLFKSSWGVLRSDKELTLLPIVSVVVSLVCVAPFLGVAALSVTETGSGRSTQTALSALGWIALAVAYFVGAYVMIFFQAALILAANDRLTGGDPTVGSALRMAAANAGRMLPWALISATVSLVIRAVQQRAGAAGRVVGAVAGVAWALVTLLVLPILVIEQLGVQDAFRRSAAAFKRTWGENVVGTGGIGLVGFVAMLVGVVAATPLLVAGQSNAALLIAGAVLLAVWLTAVSVFIAALSGVFRTALYRYAVLGEESPGFTHEQVATAFRHRGPTRR
jgi:hypothetical protein